MRSGEGDMTSARLIQRLVWRLCLALAVVGALPLAAAEPGAARLQKAKEVFDAYVRLEHAFDPAVADLYADGAVIRNLRRYPDGQVRRIEIAAPEYKALVRRAMPVARKRGDVNTYSDVTYTPEGDGVRIKADRFSRLKAYHSPLSLLVRPSPAGAWLIFEERSESRP
jgi:hypothetical protein